MGTIKTAQASKSDLSTIGKIGFSFLQFNSMALLFDYEFPPFVETLLKIQEQPATIANGVLSVDCFVKNSNVSFPSLYVKAICYLILPVFICFVCRVVFCKYARAKLTQHDVDNKVRRNRASLVQLSRMELPQDSKAQAYVNAWNHYITAVIITIFMIHPSIVQMTFALLNCKKLGALDDDHYLMQDMTVKCWATSHLIFVLLVAVPMLIFYVFGMPLFVLYRLYLNRDELTKDFKQINKNIVNRYHFLFKGYEPEFYYWEIVIIIRKVLMVCVAVFFSYDIHIQSLLATLLVVTALCVHSLACPYVTDAMDGLELLSLFGSFCTYFFGQFLFTDSVNKAGKTAVSFIIVFINITVIAAIICMVLGKGMNAVAIFGQKFRRIICCDKSHKASPKSSNNDTEDSAPRVKRTKSRKKQQSNTNAYASPKQSDLNSRSNVPIEEEDIPMLENEYSPKVISDSESIAAAQMQLKRGLNSNSNTPTQQDDVSMPQIQLQSDLNSKLNVPKQHDDVPLSETEKPVSFSDC